MKIHIDRNDEKFGPYSLEDVNRYLADGTLLPSDLGWHEGAEDWVPLNQIEGVIAGAEPPPTPQSIASGAGGKGSKTAMIAVGSLVLIAAIVFGVMQFKTTKPPAKDIFKAASDGDLEALKQHIAAGTDLNQRTPDNEKNTPLILAALFGRAETAKALIAAKADLNLGNKDGSTALHTAAFLCHTEIVEALLKAGADKNIKNNGGDTALKTVEGPFGALKLVYDILDRLFFKPSGMPLDYERIKATRPKIAKMLGGGGGAPQPAGRPPSANLQDAIFNEDLAAVKKFIAAGADINAPKPDDGSTPLHTAAFVCNIEIVKVLIAAKANVNAKNKKGETPLLVVAAPWEAMPGIYAVFGAIMQKKFDLERIQKNRVKVAEILRAAGAQ